MKAPNLTPGEWLIQHEFDNEPTFIVEAMDTEHIIAELPAPWHPANARAIVALPMVLEALETLLMRAEGDFDDAKKADDHDWMNRASSDIVTARAALTAAGYSE
jgi:hypothetical protein